MSTGSRFRRRHHSSAASNEGSPLHLSSIITGVSPQRSREELSPTRPSRPTSSAGGGRTPSPPKSSSAMPSPAARMAKERRGSSRRGGGQEEDSKDAPDEGVCIRPVCVEPSDESLSEPTDAAAASLDPSQPSNPPPSEKDCTADTDKGAPLEPPPCPAPPLPTEKGIPAPQGLRRRALRRMFVSDYARVLGTYSFPNPQQEGDEDSTSRARAPEAVALPQARPKWAGSATRHVHVHLSRHVVTSVEKMLMCQCCPCVDPASSRRGHDHMCSPSLPLCLCLLRCVALLHYTSSTLLHTFYHQLYCICSSCIPKTVPRESDSVR